MAESSLSIGYPELRREIGRFLGIGRDPAGWTADQVTDVEDILKAGLRQFYFPQEAGDSHRWSFLYPVTTLTTVSGTQTYNLPDDYGAIQGRMTFPANSGICYRPIQIVSEEMIREYAQRDTNNTRPRCAAIRPKPFDGTSGQRWQILFWPVPDAAYTLSYRYQANPAQLSTDAPYPLGGMKHAETIIESCLSVAESRMNDELGIHSANYQRLLLASIQQDRMNHTPHTYGYNSDNESIYYDERPSDLVTYNGYAPS